MRKWKWKRRRRRFRLASCGLPFIPIWSIHSALARVLRNAPSDLIRRVIAGANMNRYKTGIFGAAFVVVSMVSGSSSALAQTFENYHCADGTHFIVGFFKYDSRAHLQIGGEAVTLEKRLALSGSRYSGGGVTLLFTKGRVTVRYAKRPATVCELT
jgi:membrane-bound inhibitor of C-type lysozyme